MPGWHEAVTELREAGTLTEVALIQEQHPDRCRLFMQWKGMDFPVMVDSLDLLGVSAVPITLLIDEHGVVEAFVRSPQRDMGRVRAFVEGEVESVEPAPSELPDFEMLAENLSTGDADAMMSFADAVFLWEPSRLDTAINAYANVTKMEPDNGVNWFHFGVALRRRYESDGRKADDFAEAISAWREARRVDPNQYIWRRRIQQYGPRLDKPYSFYDWVHEARAEIAARGETPLPLLVEPGGAEFADAMRDALQTPDATEPDPDGDITRDEGLIGVESIVVPTTDDGAAWRVHVVFTPRGEGHWNNEAEPMRVWLELPEGWSADHRLVTIDNAPGATSDEVRTAEFELRAGADASDAGAIRAYALFNVCEDADGVCLFRRLDFQVHLSDGE